MRLPVLLSLLCACAPPDPAPTSGLRAPATVRVDSSGIPHIHAQNAEDAWMLQGYFTARDRMFQMDLTRRRALGRRAEILGESKRDSDVLSRALQFGTWAERTAERLREEDAEQYGWFEAYAAGVNAFLDEVEAGEAELPQQFGALGYTPERWRVEDSIAIDKLLTAGLSMRADQDVTLGLIRVLLGADGFEDLYRIAPFDRTYIVPDFYEAPAPSPAPPAPSPVPARPDERSLKRLWDRRGVLDLAQGGSNAWVVGGQHVQGGGALLASDSHQGVAHPSSYYMAHVRIDGEAGGEPAMDVIGASFPGAPFVVFGTNGDLAFAPTTAIFDVADVYLETFAGGDPAAVMFEGEAVAVERWTEELRVRSPGGTVEDAVVETLQLGHVPHHGPLLPPDALDLPLDLPLSITWTGFQPYSSARAFRGLDAARSFEDVQTALLEYRAGGMHWLIAQKDGSIGYTGRVDVPVREQVDPEQPPISLLPGTGGYEWLPGTGDRPYAQVPPSQVPWVFNPEVGWLTTANNDPVGQTDDENPWDAPVYLSGVYDIGTRAAAPAERIREVLAERPMTLDDMAAIQLDDSSRIALRILPHLLEAAGQHPELLSERGAWVIAQLAAWDLGCGVDDVAPTLFHAWLAVAVRETLEDEQGGLIGDLLFAEMDYQLGLVAVKFLAHWLDTTAADLAEIEAGTLPFPSATGRNYFDDRRTEDRVETRDELLLGAVELALSELAPRMEALGLDPDAPETWTWGAWHQLRLVDEADAVLPEASSASYPKAGGLYTVDVGDYTWLRDGELPGTLEVRNAPSNRFLFHLREDGVEGRFILPGGQSERPGAPHHLDLLAPYLAGQTRALPFSEAEIAAATEATWELPAGWPEVAGDGG